MTKRIVSFALALVMALGLMPVMAFAATPSVVYVDVSAAGWTNANAYAWSDSAGEFLGKWPGTAMTLVEGSVYSITLPAGAEKIIFNNGSAQTQDVVIPTDGTNMSTLNADGSHGGWSVYGSSSGGETEPTTDTEATGATETTESTTVTGTTYPVVYNSFNSTMVGASTVTVGVDYTCTIVPNDGFVLPESIIVFCAGENLTGYTYDSTTGELWVPGSLITYDLVITVDCDVYIPDAYGVTFTGTNVTSSGSSAATVGADYTATLTAADGYILPNGISVVVGTSLLYTGYIYNSGTGQLVIPTDLVTAEIKITAEAVVPSGAVAKIGDTEYLNLQSAINAAVLTPGVTVTLLQDISQEGEVFVDGGSFTLDLAGKEVTNSKSHVLNVTGTNLTIVDSSAEQTGLLDAGMANSSASAVYMNSGNLVLNGGSLSGKISIYLLDGTAVVNGGTMLSAVYVDGGTMTFNGGRLEHQLRFNGGQTVINDGYFAYATSYTLYGNGGALTVNGGTFNFKTSYGIRINKTASELVLAGGVYSKGIWCGASSSSYKYLSLYVADGYSFYDAAGEVVSLSSSTYRITSYCVLATTSPGARQLNITLNLSNLTSSNTAATMPAGQDYTTTLTPAEGYDLPDSVRIKVNGSTLSTSKYTYADGVITIAAAYLTGDVEITAAAVEKVYYVVAGTSDLCGTEWDGDPATSPDNVMTESGSVYVKTFASVAVKDGYQLKVVTSNDQSESAIVTFNVTAVCDVTVTYDPSTGAVTVTGDGVTIDTPTHRTVYFDNTNTQWTTVYIYSWLDSTTQYAGTWPGTAMSLVEGETNIYYYTLPVEAPYVIFNNGSSQTADLTLPELSSGQNMYNPSTNAWSTYTPAQTEEPEVPAVTYNGINLSLSGDIALNVYVTLDETLLADSDTRMVFTYGDKTQTVYLANAVNDPANGLMFSCKLWTSEMAETVSVQLYYSGGAVGDTKQSGVKMYADKVFALAAQSETYAAAFEKVIPLLKAMLNYGAAVQAQFTDDTADQYANVSLSDADKVLNSDYEHAGFKHVITGAEDGISITGANLVLDSTTSIRYTFTLDGTKTIDAYTFVVNGKEVAPVYDSTTGTYHVDMVGIMANNLDYQYTCQVGGLSIAYSALSYVHQVNQYYPDNTGMIAFADALYAYSMAAEAYCV